VTPLTLIRLPDFASRAIYYRMNIPIYPLSELLSLKHKSLFDEILLQDPAIISEFTFTNLFSWRDAYRFAIAKCENFLIVSSNMPHNLKFLKPLGPGNPAGAIERILRDSKGIFMKIPEATVNLLRDNSAFVIDFDRDNSDYLFRISDLISLQGAKYDGKRNLIKNFKSHYSYEYIPLSGDCAPMCLEFEERWCVIKNCDSVEGLTQERLAIKEMVTHFSNFNLLGGAIAIERRICAVAIAELLNPQTLVMHVLKADPNIPGLYQTIHNEFLAHITLPCTYVNFEQDLGIEGLRKAKLSYHPYEIVKKYTVRLSQ
jgi:hypothetical protein